MHSILSRVGRVTFGISTSSGTSPTQCFSAELSLVVAFAIKILHIHNDALNVHLDKTIQLRASNLENL